MASTSFDKEDGRHFKNVNPDFDADNCSEIVDGQISEEKKSKIRSMMNNLVVYLSKNLNSLDRRDETVYTGLSGVGYMFWYLSSREEEVKRRGELLQTAVDLVTQALKRKPSGEVSFLIGDPGPKLTALLTGARYESREEQVKELLAMKNRANDLRTPDEVLYGRAGYLYALLVLRQQEVLVTDVDEVIKEIVATILLSGTHLSSRLKDCKKRPPLMYEWCHSYYLGAAHGLVGIMYLLLQVPQYLMETEALTKYIRPTIDWLMTLRYPSGNFPSSWSKETDKLVHWCHGAPGWVYMLLRAYEVFKDNRYLECAVDCGQVIWTRGLLQKGYGICHGVAGNGYAFLALYKATGEEKHLYRALKFAEFCCDYGQHGCNQPDTVFSLYEGLAGTICFLRDMLNPKEARFPGYEL